MTLSINSIVAGKVGHFIVLGFRNDLSNETYAQLKAYDLPTGRVARGELALPVSILSTVPYDTRLVACIKAAIASLVALRKTRFYDSWDAIVVTARKFHIDAEDLSAAWDAPHLEAWIAEYEAE